MLSNVINPRMKQSALYKETPQTYTLSIQSEKSDPKQWLKLTNQKTPIPYFDWLQLTKCNL